MAGYQNVSLSTINSNIYNTLFTLINTNKPTGWTVLASFPEKTPTFPCIVVRPANVNVQLLTLQRNKKRLFVTVDIEIYAKSEDRLEKIDVGRQNIKYTLLTNFSTLKQYGLMLEQSPNAIEESDVVRDNFNGQDLNAATLTLNLMAR